jgi:hypothetical protein
MNSFRPRIVIINQIFDFVFYCLWHTENPWVSSEIFSIESEDLSEDHVYSYQKKIHGLIDKYNTAINNEYAIKNEFVVMAWHKIRPGLWFTVERVKSIVQFHKGYYKSNDYECAISRLAKLWRAIIL